MNRSFVAALGRCLPLAAVLPLALAACAPRTVPVEAPAPAIPDGERMCTMEFRTYSVRVESPRSTPVSDVRLDVRRADGTSLVCSAEGQTGCVNVREYAAPESPNHFTIMTDGVPIARGGENITVNATANGRTVAGIFRFEHDGCHVRKVSGPDVLTLGD